MKNLFGLGIFGVCTFATLTFGQKTSDNVVSPPPGKEQHAATDSASARSLTLAEAKEKIVAARRYPAHPSAEKPGKRPEPRATSPDFEIAEPPPPDRAEPKPPSPVPGYVWVPGFHMPVKGKWQWVSGEWALPATPISVWIPARYDRKEKTWTPGYWQPDRPTPTEPDATAKDSVSAVSAPN